MEFSVTRISQGLVAPSRPTPSEVLELSVIDRLPVLRCNARTLHVFRHGPGAAKVIREALSKALISYYPLAGKLHVSDQNEVQVACTGDGIWFVEALADCTLDSVNYFDDAMSIPYEKLLPIIPPHENDDGPDPLIKPILLIVSSLSICDGLGAAQFLNAVGEMARGAEQPSIKPEWRRDFLDPPRGPNLNNPFVMSQPPPIPIPDYQLEQATIDLSLDKIKDLKQKFQKWSDGKKWCSTFEMVAAMLWRERTRAINETQPVKLVFFANCRQLISDPPLPKGFYGNCFFPVTVTMKNEEEKEEKTVLFKVVKQIQEAKAGLHNEFAKWIMMSKDDEFGDPFAPPLEYSTLFISEWDRLGFKEVDYGWGNPIHIVPVQGSSIIPVGIVCSPPAPKMGIRLMTWCVQQNHLQPLLQSFNTLMS